MGKKEGTNRLPRQAGAKESWQTHGVSDVGKKQAGNAVTKRKWYSLYDKVYALSNLERAWKKVRSNRGAGGVDQQTIVSFGEGADKHLKELHRLLREKHYRPQAPSSVHSERQWRAATIGDTGGRGQSCSASATEHSGTDIRAAVS